jgi:hypothetical protein
MGGLHPSPGMELDIRGVRVEDGVEQLHPLPRFGLSGPAAVRAHHPRQGHRPTAPGCARGAEPSKHVRAWEEGKDGEGGPGVTVAHLVEHK